jgi:hypothetical protein
MIRIAPKVVLMALTVIMIRISLTAWEQKVYKLNNEKARECYHEVIAKAVVDAIGSRINV